jgi:hypothetical protein
LEGSRFPNCASSCLAAIEDQVILAIRNRQIGCIHLPVQALARPGLYSGGLHASLEAFSVKVEPAP